MTTNELPALTAPTVSYAVCVHESDGYHVHRYTVDTTINGALRTLFVEDNLHAWMDDHLTRWPDAYQVAAVLRSKSVAQANTLADMWVVLGVTPAAEPPCTINP